MAQINDIGLSPLHYAIDHLYCLTKGKQVSTEIHGFLLQNISLH